MTNFRMALLDLLRKGEQGADPPEGAADRSPIIRH
jgi:hypothetical protein